MKKIILCADDFGENKSISDGILDLVKKKRLSAVSCMTTASYWPTAASELKLYDGSCHVGLHFNLTEGHSLTGYPCVMPLNHLIIRSHLRLLNTEWIAAELRQQIESFKKNYGRLPDFIDGHQHVHHLPQVQTVLLDVYCTYYPNKNAFVRVSVGSWAAAMRYPKVLIIALMGGYRLKKRLAKKHIRYNTSFSGFYNFSATSNYRDLFKFFLKESQEGGLVMCHPGKEPIEPTDAIGLARVSEYHYFNSDEFLSDCSEASVNFFAERS